MGRTHTLCLAQGVAPLLHQSSCLPAPLQIVCSNALCRMALATPQSRGCSRTGKESQAYLIPQSSRCRLDLLQLNCMSSTGPVQLICVSSPALLQLVCMSHPRRAQLLLCCLPAISQGFELCSLLLQAPRQRHSLDQSWQHISAAALVAWPQMGCKTSSSVGQLHCMGEAPVKGSGSHHAGAS